MIQKGYSQGHKLDNGLERFAQDLRDIEEHASALHYVAHKIVSFEVICSDGRYRSFNLMTKIQKSNFVSLYRGILGDDSLLHNKSCRSFGSDCKDQWELSKLQYEAHKDFISKLNRESGSPAQERPPKRSR